MTTTEPTSRLSHDRRAVVDFLEAVEALMIPDTADLLAEVVDLAERSADLSNRLRDVCGEYERMLTTATAFAGERFPLEAGAVDNGGDALWSFLAQATGYLELFTAASHLAMSFDPDSLTQSVRLEMLAERDTD